MHTAISEALAPIRDLEGASVGQLPQTVFVEIRSEETSRYITILRNNAHLNITSMFAEQKYRAPEEDTLSVVSGLLGSYPNALWRVEASKLMRFTASLASIEKSPPDAIGLFLFSAAATAVQAVGGQSRARMMSRMTPICSSQVS